MRSQVKPSAGGWSHYVANLGSSTNSSSTARPAAGPGSLSTAPHQMMRSRSSAADIDDYGSALHLHASKLQQQQKMQQRIQQPGGGPAPSAFATHQQQQREPMDRSPAAPSAAATATAAFGAIRLAATASIPEASSEDGLSLKSEMASLKSARSTASTTLQSISAARTSRAVKQFTPEANSAHGLVTRLLQASSQYTASDRASMAAIAQEIKDFAAHCPADRQRLVAAGAVPALVKLLELPLVPTQGGQPHTAAACALEKLAGKGDGDDVTREAIAAAGVCASWVVVHRAGSMFVGSGGSFHVAHLYTALCGCCRVGGQK